MAIVFESDGRGLTTTKLVVRGVAFLVVAAALVAAGFARSQGAFEPRVRVTAIMADVGDGLPTKSDVKYRGVLVGTVVEVEPSTGGGPNRVRIDLEPDDASGIPATVTARVVPSNVFAVPSIQLVDNGAGPPLAAGAEIAEDRSLATVQLQTSLTALSRIAAAAGRSAGDPTVGILETVQRATSGRGPEAVRAGAQLERIVRAFSELTTPDGTDSTLAELSGALEGLRASAPDLLAAVNHAVVPMQSMAAQRARFAELVSGGLVTTTTVGTALTNRTDTILDMTSKMAPVLDVLAAGSQNFVQMTTSQRNISEKFSAEFWRADTQSATGKIIIELTPHKQYSRADCPRYGQLAAPSCVTGPEGPAVLGTADGPTTVPAADVDEPIGGATERVRIGEILGRAPDALSTVLLSPLVRGNDVRITPTPDGAPTGGEQGVGEPR
ncbi:MlaD family protein [Nocardia bovistercoris]|uniref:MCE family protein n=1 Tax=Nocardia bovistercoris TaxID=2785916 RepID=A0A931I9I7_9NOCA|nr:MlaD family protein [Nocardia bovistercoris]MBH0776355.1 MCE family protein [Nocardia bovistercoris]